MDGLSTGPILITMGKDTAPEIKQPKKRGRPQKYSEGEKASHYFKTLGFSTMAKTAPDSSPAMLSLENSKPNDGSKMSEKQKQKRYRLTYALKSFATTCTAFPVEWWEEFRVDRHSRCGLCGEMVEGMDLLREHIREHLFLKCLLCSSFFNRLDLFKSHMQQHSSTLMKGNALPCSSAVLNKKIDVETNSDQNGKSAGELTAVQNERQIVGESAGVQNEKMVDGSTAVTEGNPSDIMRVGRSMPEIDFQEEELIIGQFSSSFDGQALSGARSQPRTDNTVENRGSDRSHCSVTHINHSAPTSVRPLVCSICNFQSRGVTALCKHNHQYHNLESCLCQNSCSNDNVEKGTGDQPTVTVEKPSLSEARDPKIEINDVSDHASYCRPDTDVSKIDLEIIDVDSEAEHPIPSRRPINSNIATNISDDSSDSCIVFITDLKNMPYPLIPMEFGSKSMSDKVEIHGNQISSGSCATVGNRPIETPRFPAPSKLNVIETISLLDYKEVNNRVSRTVVLDDCEVDYVYVSDGVCVQEVPSKPKHQEVKRRSSGANKTSKATKTGPGPYSLIPVEFGSISMSDEVGIHGNKISSESGATVGNRPIGTPRFPAPSNLNVSETISLLDYKDGNYGASKTVVTVDCEDDDVCVQEGSSEPKPQDVKRSSRANKKSKATKTGSGPYPLIPLEFGSISKSDEVGIHGNGISSGSGATVGNIPVETPRFSAPRNLNVTETISLLDHKDDNYGVSKTVVLVDCEDDGVCVQEGSSEPKHQEVKRSSGAYNKSKATKTGSGPYPLIPVELGSISMSDEVGIHGLRISSGSCATVGNRPIEAPKFPAPSKLNVRETISLLDYKDDNYGVSKTVVLDDCEVDDVYVSDDVCVQEGPSKPKHQEVKRRSSGANEKSEATKTGSEPYPLIPVEFRSEFISDEVRVRGNQIFSGRGATVVKEPVEIPRFQASVNLYVNETISLLDDKDYNDGVSKTVVLDGDVLEVLEDHYKSKNQVKRSSEAVEKSKATITDSGPSLDEPSAKKRCEDDDVVEVQEDHSKSNNQAKRSSEAVERSKATKTDSRPSLDEPSAKKRCEDDDVVEVQEDHSKSKNQVKRSSEAVEKSKAIKTDSGPSLDEPSAKKRCEDDDVVEVQEDHSKSKNQVKRSSEAVEKSKAIKTDSGPSLDEPSAKKRCEDDDVVEVQEDHSKSKNQVKRSSKAVKKNKATKTDSGLSLDEPSAKKSREDDEMVEVQEGHSKSKNQEVKRSKGADEKSKATKIDSGSSLDEPSTKKRKNITKCTTSVIENNSSSHKSRSKSWKGRVSKHEFKSLFCDVPKSFVATRKISPSATKRVTRHSVSSNDRSDPCITIPGTVKNPDVERSKKKSNRNNSSKVNFLTKLHLGKGNNEPKVANITIEVLDDQGDRHNKKIRKVPRTVISGEDFKSFSWVVESTSGTAKSRANDKKWKKLLKAAGASESSPQIGQSDTKNDDNHCPESETDDEDVSYNASKTLTGADELESGILAGLTNFEVVDVRSFDESMQESHENEVDESTTCKDPLALSFDDAEEHDNVFGVQGTSDDLPIVLQPSNVRVNFDDAKFVSRIPTTTAIQIEDVPELVEGQWLVYHYVYHRFDRLVEKVLAFSNKRSYFNSFGSEDPHENIPSHKIIKEYTYFCDYRKGNHTTIPVKFKHLDRKLIGGSNTKMSRAVSRRNDSMKLSPWVNVPLTELGKGSTNLTCHGNGVQKNVEGNTMQNQENSLPVGLGHNTVDDNNGILGSCGNYAAIKENDACSVELETDASNEKRMELMNEASEMKSNEKLGDMEENNIKTNDNASFEELKDIIHNEELNTEETVAINDTRDMEGNNLKTNDNVSFEELKNINHNEELNTKETAAINDTRDTEGNNIKTKDNASLEELKNIIHNEEIAAINDTMDVRKSPVLINGKMKFFGHGRSDLKNDSIPALHQISSNSDLSKESLKSSTNDDKSGYWGFSDPETEKEDLIAVDTPKPVNETIEAESIVADIHDIFKIPDDETGLSENIGHGQDGWDQLDKVLKKIDEIPTPYENLSHKSIKPLSKKTASLLVHKNFDSSTGIPAAPSIGDNIENTFHIQRQLNSQILHNEFICESTMKEKGMFRPVVPDENQQEISSIQKPVPLPSCSSVTNYFDLRAGITGEQFMKNEGQIGNSCHPQRELNAHVQHHHPVYKSKPREWETACPNENQLKRSEVSSTSTCTDIHRMKVEKSPIDGSGPHFYLKETNNIARFYDGMQKKLDRAESATEDENDFTTVDILDHMYCHSSSGSSSPDYVDDIVLQAGQSRGSSHCVDCDPRESCDCMPPPLRHRPPSSLSSGSMYDFGSPRSLPFSPSPPRRTLHTPHYIKKERFDSSPSLSPASDRSMESSEVSGSPIFDDCYDSDL